MNEKKLESIPLHGYSSSTLKDGRILICGGYAHRNGDAVALGSSWIYDPHTKKLSNGPCMKVARGHHSSSTTSDGRVLIAGGELYTDILRSFEIYDPSSNTFEICGHMISNRCFHLSHALRDGRILICGGVGLLCSLMTTEIYDPRTQQSKIGPNMAFSREAFDSVELDDGRIFIYGGHRHLESCDIYDPVSNKFAMWDNKTPVHCDASAFSSYDGNVFMHWDDDYEIQVKKINKKPLPQPQ